MKTTTADNIETKSARHGAAKNFRLTIGTVERGQFKKVIEFDPSSARVELKMGVHAVLVGPLDAPRPIGSVARSTVRIFPSPSSKTASW
jgi:hypothetical protein